MGRGRPKQKRSNKLTPDERGRAIGMLEMGAGVKETARKIGCEPKSIRELKKKYKITGTTEDRPRSGRPKKTSPREDRTIKFSSLRNRKLTGKAIALKLAPNFTKNRVSIRTIRSRLSESGLNGRVARKKPLLKADHIKKRYQWSKDHLDWKVSDWKKVIFSDESPFTLFATGGKMYVRRRPGEEYLPECIAPTVKFGGGKIQVWGCFSWYGAGPVYRIKGNMTGVKYRQILKDKMAPFMRNTEGKLGIQPIFQHDNDPKHRSKVAKNYLSNQQFKVLSWPSQSPDMNPIENAWKHVKDNIYGRVDKASNLDEVFDIVKEEWEKISLEYFRKLISSMPDRVKALYSAHGHSTKY
jgi:hypothetical protein